MSPKRYNSRSLSSKDPTWSERLCSKWILIFKHVKEYSLMTKKSFMWFARHNKQTGRSTSSFDHRCRSATTSKFLLKWFYRIKEIKAWWAKNRARRRCRKWLTRQSTELSRASTLFLVMPCNMRCLWSLNNLSWSHCEPVVSNRFSYDLCIMSRSLHQQELWTRTTRSLNGRKSLRYLCLKMKLKSSNKSQ